MIVGFGSNDMSCVLLIATIGNRFCVTKFKRFHVFDNALIMYDYCHAIRSCLSDCSPYVNSIEQGR